MITALLMALAMPQAAPAGSVAAAPAAESPAAAARRVKAHRLAQLLSSEAMVVDAGDDSYIKMTSDVMLAQPDVPELERKYPGVVDAMVRASLPIAKRQMHNRLPLLWDRLSDLYLANFTTPELDQAIAFYGSPTGQKMIAQMVARMKPNAIAADLKKDPEAGVSVDSFRKDMKATVPGVVGSLTPKEQAALLAFSRTSVFPKIARIGPRSQELVVAWSQEATPEETKDLVDSMKAAMLARIDATKAEAK